MYFRYFMYAPADADPPGRSKPVLTGASALPATGRLCVHCPAPGELHQQPSARPL
jgi:hypothetical protein